MIFVPLLHYFASKNTYSGNEEGMRYRLTPGKRTVTGEDGTESEEKTLTVDIWPDPWTLEFTAPELRRQQVYQLNEDGRAQAAKYLKDTYDSDVKYWKQHPSILDSDPWTPPDEQETEQPKD